MEIQITIEGLDSFSRALQRAPQETVNVLGNAVQKSAFLIKQYAMREAPVAHRPGGGYLRQHIQALMTGRSSAVIYADAKHAIFVQEGTRPHIIRPVVKRVLAANARFSNWPNVRNGYAIFGTLVHHPGTRPNPFMTRAVDKAKTHVLAYFEEAAQQLSAILTR